MMKSEVKATWTDSFKKGEGKFTSINPVMDGVNFHFMKKQNKPAITPEEFLSAALSACFNMTFANIISEAAKNAEIKTLDTKCVISYQPDAINGAELVFSADIEGLSKEEIEAFANQAKSHCPISKSYAFPVTLTLAL